jgi:hypothetical protein
MRAAGSLRPLLVWVMPVAVLGLVVAVIVFPRIASGPSRPATPVTRTRPLDLRHHRDVGYTNEYLYDSTYETCEAVGITQLARKLGVPAAPLTRLARAFADQNYTSAVRSGPYHGCLDALVSHRREDHRR